MYDGYDTDYRRVDIQCHSCGSQQKVDATRLPLYARDVTTRHDTTILALCNGRGNS